MPLRDCLARYLGTAHGSFECITIRLHSTFQQSEAVRADGLHERRRQRVPMAFDLQASILHAEVDASFSKGLSEFQSYRCASPFDLTDIASIQQTKVFLQSAGARP